MTDFTRLFNPIDLIIIAILVFFTVTGFLRGALRTLYLLLGRLAVMAGAVMAAQLLAPTVADFIVTPLVGKLFSEQAALAQASGLLPSLQENVTQYAANMAQSAAFLILTLLFITLFSFLLAFAMKSLRALAQLTPLGIVDSLGGALLGLGGGILLIAAILIGIEWFSPITYTSLGFLSPERVHGTVLLARFIELLPVAI